MIKYVGVGLVSTQKHENHKKEQKMKPRYGFFGGCFNPVTKAHINLARLVVEQYNLDKLIFVPMGDHYQKSNLANEQHRYEMLKLATKNQAKLEVSDIELNLPHHLTMLQAFKKIQANYKEVTPYFIIGADNLIKLTGLSDFETLAKNYEYIIIKRDIPLKRLFTEEPILQKYHTHFHILEKNPYKQISASEARALLKSRQEREIDTMISAEVFDYIRKNGLYE